MYRKSITILLLTIAFGISPHVNAEEVGIQCAKGYVYHPLGEYCKLFCRDPYVYYNGVCQLRKLEGEMCTTFYLDGIYSIFHDTCNLETYCDQQTQTCVAKTAVGNECDDIYQHECADNSACLNGLCVPKLTIDEPCGPDSAAVCDDHLFCDDSSTCQPRIYTPGEHLP